MSEKKKSEFGIWKKSVRLKSGEESEVFSFSVNGVRYNAWPNKYKSSEKAPDYNAYIDDYVRPADTSNNQEKPTSTPVQKAAPKTAKQDDGLPF